MKTKTTNHCCFQNKNKKKKRKSWVDAQAHLPTATKNYAVCWPAMEPTLPGRYTKCRAQQPDSETPCMISALTQPGMLSPTPCGPLTQRGGGKCCRVVRGYHIVVISMIVLIAWCVVYICAEVAILLSRISPYKTTTWYPSGPHTLKRVHTKSSPTFEEFFYATIGFCLNRYVASLPILFIFALCKNRINFLEPLLIIGVSLLLIIHLFSFNYFLFIKIVVVVVVVFVDIQKHQL